MRGDHYDGGVGVSGYRAADVGVKGESGTAIGVHGKSSEPGYGAVYGQHTANGTGVWGISASGYGGQLQGGKAQLS